MDARRYPPAAPGAWREKFERSMDRCAIPLLALGCSGTRLYHNDPFRTLLAHPVVGEELSAFLSDMARRLEERELDAWTPEAVTAAFDRVMLREGFVLRCRAMALEAGLLTDGPSVLLSGSLMEPETAPVEELAERFELTRRQAEVAGLLGRGLSNKAVASALDISPHTARHHTQTVLRKLGVTSRAEVAALVGIAPRRCL